MYISPDQRIPAVCGTGPRECGLSSNTTSSTTSSLQTACTNKSPALSFVLSTIAPAMAPPTRSARAAPRREEPKKRRGRPPGHTSTGAVSKATTRITKNVEERKKKRGGRISTGSTIATTKGAKAKVKVKPGAEHSVGVNKGSVGATEGMRKRGRPFGRARDEEGPAKKKGRPSGGILDDEIPKRKRGRPSITRNKERPAKRQKGPSDPGIGEVDNEPDEISEKRPQTRTYVQLVPRTRRIAQEKIDTWPQVSPQVLDQMVGMLRDAKKDIVNTQRDERRAMLADETLEVLVGKLTRQLASSKIPPQAKDVHFNIDKLTERYAQLFRNMTTERHSKQLLKEQIKVAQHLLAKDQENFQQLEKHAKQWKAEWKHREKHGRIHPLLEEVEEAGAEGNGREDIGLVSSRKRGDARAAELESPDSELAPLLEQLRRNLENLQGDHDQIAGMDDAVQKVQVALDDVLFRHASVVQYAAL